MPALPLPLLLSDMSGNTTTVSYKDTGSRVLTTGQTFAKQDLPKEHRVLEPGSMKTMDFKPDRLNIHVGEDGTVQNVKFG